MQPTVESWKRRGEAARLAHEAVHRAFRERVRDTDPERYAALLRDFHTKTAAALPTSQPGFLANLAAGSPGHAETAIAYLEADPYFFRSGYQKQDLIRHLKRIDLSEALRQRLTALVIRAIDTRTTEFRHYCRLACGIWSDALDEAVADRLASSDPEVSGRALRVATAAISAGKA